MNSLEMLRKIKNKDEGAFDELMDKYGMSVYMRLLGQLGDKELADEAFKRTMLEFYNFIIGLEGEDIVEAMLFARADQVQQSIVDGSLTKLISEIREELKSEAPVGLPPTEAHEMQDIIIEESAHEEIAVPEPEAVEEPVRAEKMVEVCAAVESVEAEETTKALTAEPAMAEAIPAAPIQEPSVEAEETPKALTAEPAMAEAIPAAPIQEPSVEAEPKKSGAGMAILYILLFLLLCAFAWVIIGVLMSRGIIPAVDLGFGWFNENVYPLFMDACFYL